MSINRRADIGKCTCLTKAWVCLPILGAAARAAELVIQIHDLPACVHGQCLLDRGHKPALAPLVDVLVEDGQAQVHALHIAQSPVVTPLALDPVLCHPAEDILQGGPLGLHVTPRFNPGTSVLFHNIIPTLEI